MRDREDFERLLAEGESADVSGWDFSWLNGRATEERPPWGYSTLLAKRLRETGPTVELDT